jgi:hypothetical protein
LTPLIATTPPGTSSADKIRDADRHVKLDQEIINKKQQLLYGSYPQGKPELDDQGKPKSWGDYGGAPIDAGNHAPPNGIVKDIAYADSLLTLKKADLAVKIAATQTTLDWLDAELVKQQRKVEDSERALAQYREKQNAMSLDDRNNVVVSRYQRINDELMKARSEKTQRQALYEQVRSISNGTSPDVIPAVSQNTQVTASKMQDILGASTATIAPYRVTGGAGQSLITVKVSEVSTDSGGIAKVQWSRSFDGTTVSTGWPVGQVMTLPPST